MAQRLDALLSWTGLSLEAVLLIIGAGLAGTAAAFFALAAARRLSKPERGRLLGVLAERCAAPVHLLLPVLAISIALPGIDTSTGIAALLPRALSIAAIAATGWLVLRGVRGFVDHVIASNSMEHADNFEARQIQTQIRLLGRVLAFIVTVATIAGVLVAIPSIRNIGVSLFASAGIAGLAVGLAARPALGNLIAGIQIALTQPIRIEDAVVVEGEWGWIEEINMTFVVVRIWDLRRLVLPISYFIEKPFQNWTRTTADILGSVMLYTDYTVPVDEIRAEFGRALRASTYWDGKVEVVHVTECTERTMQLRLLMSARNSPDAWELRCEVRERVIGYLQQHYPDSLPRLRLDSDTAQPEATPKPADAIGSSQ
ncbi:MAG: mechanosensitive ion channel family protein [Gammaproteobacteria bacterium]